MPEENSEIRDPKHINQIFRILKKEYAIIENSPEDNMRILYHVYMIPVCLPNTMTYAVEAFETILNGVMGLESAPKDPPVADIIELVADEGNIKSYSYIVAAIEEDAHNNKNIAESLYVFLRPATSMYHGEGPRNREKIQKIIDSKIPMVRQKEYNIDNIYDFVRLFNERGPIVEFSLSTFYIYTGEFDYDKRFI